MEQQRIFRPYQQQLNDDHNFVQDAARGALDHAVRDLGTLARRYSGFNVTKTAQTEVTVAPGRMYAPNDDADGTAVYRRVTSLVQSMTPYLAAAALRVVSLSAYGVENEIDAETRNFAVIANPDQPLEIGQPIPTEPDNVAMTRSRDAVLVFTQGAESADPQPPALPATHVEIARILLDATQVVSVTMLTDNQVRSTEGLDVRLRDQETFKRQIEPRVKALGSDLASLQNQVGSLGGSRQLQRIAEDVARLKASLGFPDAAADYGADPYLTPGKSDIADDLEKGFDAKVEEGVRFPNANAAESEISLFSANDPNAQVTSGVLLPKYTHELKLTTAAGNPAITGLGIGQYLSQVVTMKQGAMTRMRVRYGDLEAVTASGNHIQIRNPEPFPEGSYAAAMALYDDFHTLEVIEPEYFWRDPQNPADDYIRYEQSWLDYWKEPFIYAVVTQHVLNGAFVAQSFSVGNDIWATKLGIYIVSKAANEDIHLSLHEVRDGVPDLTRTMMKTVLAHADIAIGWNYVTIPPTFMQKGKKLAVGVVSNANHQIGMVTGQSYLDGTFYTSTDGIYSLGDLTKDMALEIHGARFNAAQVTIEFGALSLDGGMRTIDILAEAMQPESTELIHEVRPNGTGEWQPLSRFNTGVLAGAPPLVQHRARFVGSRDMMPALKLTGSRVKVFRPKTTFRHVSAGIELAASCDEIHVKVVLDHFDEAVHDHTCKLWTGAAYDTEEAPDATVTKLIDAVLKRYEREYTFNLGAGVTDFAIEQNGVVASVANLFVVGERTHYGIAA